ncbi:MAG: HI0074 family nucleotidyltransferase substrate-binding subunit [Verrucomicrobiota bacterium]|nr:HI0074 family nucleotidyltransferase substrate-binding subunit [Verrucomicrobiota bacterium]
MDKTRQKIESFIKALKTFDAILLENDDSNIIRDAAIQRFEYTFEAMWKASKAYLLTYEGVTSTYPKNCIRNMMQNNILSPNDTELSLEMVDSRNLTSHTYIEEIAIGIYTKLKTYNTLMNKVMNELDKLTN